ncbi:MAG: hypothetical protein Q9166_007386 [cf. Caloplaca sp. 2 TL-2023]
MTTPIKSGFMGQVSSTAPARSSRPGEMSMLKDFGGFDKATLTATHGLDLLNHNPAARVTWQWTDSVCAITSNEELSAGTEIFNNYAPKSNEELIMGYGFSLFKNVSDHCNLALGTMAVARIKDALGQESASPHVKHASQDSKLSVAEASQVTNPERPVTGVGWVRLTHSWHDQKGTRAGHMFSPSFLEQTSIAFSNAREHGQGFSSTDVHLFAAPLTRNKLHTICAIAMILQKQSAELAEKDFELPAWPNNQRQFHAARYRRGQLHILRTVSDSILAGLRGLAGLDLSWPRDKRLIRLEHILKAGPKELLQDFRAVLHIGFGTRNPEKIRQRMLLDSAFTLWLYGLWLWALPTSNLGRLPSDRPALPTRTASWITFVCQTYGDESDIGQRWAEISASEEGQALAESCYFIIKAAVAKNPRSIYNSSDVNTGRLLWCLRVVREESFMCPNLEGQMGDETDEIMLFLE